MVSPAKKVIALIDNYHVELLLKQLFGKPQPYNCIPKYQLGIDVATGVSY